MFAFFLVLSFIIIFVIVVFIFCYFLILHHMIYLNRANTYITSINRPQRVVPETNIEIPELPLPLAEGIKIDNEIEDLEVIQIN